MRVVRWLLVLVALGLVAGFVASLVRPHRAELPRPGPGVTVAGVAPPRAAHPRLARRAACAVPLVHALGARRRAPRAGSRTTATAVEAKEAWLSATLLDWGSCGQVVRVDGAVAATRSTRRRRTSRGSRRTPRPRSRRDAVLLATLHVEPEHADRGLARMLVQGMAADLARRGVRAVEAIASHRRRRRRAWCRRTSCSRSGSRRCARTRGTPRLRLDLRSTVAWREDVVEAALDRLLGGRRQVGALHREDPTS